MKSEEKNSTPVPLALATGNDTYRFDWGMGQDSGYQTYFAAGDVATSVGDGADYLDGEAGNDTLLGEGGDDDTLERGTFTDPVTGKTSYGRLFKSGGADTVVSGVGQTLENLTLTGTTEANGVCAIEANALTGNEAANALYAYRPNGVVENYFDAPLLGGSLVQFTSESAVDPVEELLLDRANLGLWRGEFESPFGPVHAEIIAGEGDDFIEGGNPDQITPVFLVFAPQLQYGRRVA